MKKIVFGILTLLIISCNQKQTSKFSLTGTTKEFENGTMIYLNVKNKAIDSAKIENNSFFFNTAFSNFPVKATLRIEQPPQYKSIWIENNPMIFDASDTGFIRYAVISGSKTENEERNFYKENENLSQDEMEKKQMEFIKDNPDNIISAYLLSFYTTTWGSKQTQKLFSPFSLKNKESDFGKQIIKYLEVNKDPKIGDNFVDFEMKDQNGKMRRLSEVKQKVTLLEFWASNCGGCRLENPNLVKTYAAFKDKGFEIFAVSLDSEEESWKQAIKKDSLSWIQVSDLKGEENIASLIYGVNFMPSNYLITSDGKIIAQNLKGEVLHKKVKELLE